MADGWPVAAPAKAGLDPQLICSIGESLEHLEDAVPHQNSVIPGRGRRLRTRNP